MILEAYWACSEYFLGNRFLAFLDFKGDNAVMRTADIKAFLQGTVPSLAENICIEHVYKGPAGNRKFTGTSLVLFPSKAQKEAAMKAITDGNCKMSGNNVDVKIRFGKSNRQRHRNWCLNEAVMFESLTNLVWN